MTQRQEKKLKAVFTIPVFKAGFKGNADIRRKKYLKDSTFVRRLKNAETTVVPRRFFRLIVRLKYTPVPTAVSGNRIDPGKQQVGKRAASFFRSAPLFSTTPLILNLSSFFGALPSLRGSGRTPGPSSLSSSPACAAECGQNPIFPLGVYLLLSLTSLSCASAAIRSWLFTSSAR